ncbi:dihydrolipoyl dehydrogenase [Actinobacteria bacterium YIM 96077]|uniref:Dihydrolipoyl dehydrogenase n=1 Tax=Phytoactinopolyspora halophila TaxID=1981511 RepID=A0A329QG14_9ACTN|nr:dihydrolipoyl dehydrogenase [Phytoactinopolyspora halophila]AYY13697.1 dihydrolipoyl dehydrogenase [Actinobacteria bacterium YIM 96077]RAW11260.1 dihydrolipoyl dehydrogenase [Phytoactinopolyspora halophila]
MASEASEVDVIVLGGGSGGYAAAFRAAELGLSVTLVEKDKVGGTCLHYGCIPTKALLHAAEVADVARDGERFGVTSTVTGIDMAKVNEYKNGVVGRLHKGLQGLVKANKVNLVEGAGRLVGPNTVEVDGTRYTGRHIVLATGSHARSLPGLDIDGSKVLTSYEALELDRVPASVVVLGGGVIGVEFASVWRSFGAEVTIVEALPRLLPGEDEASSKIVDRAFRKRGMAIKTGSRFAGVEHTDDGVSVSLENGETVEAEMLLVAIGRGPVTEGLGFSETGVGLDNGFVATDERLRTSIPGVYAVGDLVAGLQLAHRGFAHGIFVAEDIAGLDPVPVEDAGIPRITYCDPEVASVGLTAAAAQERLGTDKVTTFDYNLAGNGRSQILATQGSVKVVQEVDGPVLGVHMVGGRIGELIAEAQLIYNWEALPAEVAQLVHPHPTQSEALGEAHLALAGKPLHVHG